MLKVIGIVAVFLLSQVGAYMTSSYHHVYRGYYRPYHSYYRYYRPYYSLHPHNWFPSSPYQRKPYKMCLLYGGGDACHLKFRKRLREAY